MPPLPRGSTSLNCFHISCAAVMRWLPCSKRATGRYLSFRLDFKGVPFACLERKQSANLLRRSGVATPVRRVDMRTMVNSGMLVFLVSSGALRAFGQPVRVDSDDLGGGGGSGGGGPGGGGWGGGGGGG